MILNGFDEGTSQLVEIVDFNSNLTTCANLPNYPLIVRGTFGGLLDNKVPLVCGGPSVRECYQYNQGQWQLSFPMKENRFHANGIVTSPYKNSLQKFYVIGGSSPNSEVLTSTGWETIMSPQPKTFYMSCIVTLDETSFMLLGSFGIEKETYIFNAATNTWTSGPSLITGRRGTGCGKIAESSTSNKQIIVAAGGDQTPRSIEFLDGVNSKWRAGIKSKLTYQSYISYIQWLSFNLGKFSTT
jgi:hypothetical protein